MSYPLLPDFYSVQIKRPCSQPPVSKGKSARLICTECGAICESYQTPEHVEVTEYITLRELSSLLASLTYE